MATQRAEAYETVTDGSENKHKLYFESPPNNAAIDYNHAANSRYNGRQAHLENFITVRVFFKISEDAGNTLFKKVFDCTPSPQQENQGQEQMRSSINSHPLHYDGESQVYIDIDIQQHLNCADLIIRTIDWFNEHFKEQGSQYVLEDHNLEMYQLYMAKKNGKPNDDFPSIEKAQIVAKINYNRFALCLEKQALHLNPSKSVQSYQTHISVDPYKFNSVLIGEKPDDLSNNRTSTTKSSQKKNIGQENRQCQSCCSIF